MNNQLESSSPVNLNHDSLKKSIQEKFETMKKEHEELFQKRKEEIEGALKEALEKNSQ